MYRVKKDMSGWKELCGWRPENADEIMELAKEIRREFVNSREASRNLTPQGDHVYAHGLLFFRDALLLRVFQHAVKHGDPGLVLRVLKNSGFIHLEEQAPQITQENALRSSFNGTQGN